jgi:hypothetical protein
VSTGEGVQIHCPDAWLSEGHPRTFCSHGTIARTCPDAAPSFEAQHELSFLLEHISEVFLGQIPCVEFVKWFRDFQHAQGTGELERPSSIQSPRWTPHHCAFSGTFARFLHCGICAHHRLVLYWFSWGWNGPVFFFCRFHPLNLYFHQCD